MDSPAKKRRVNPEAAPERVRVFTYGTLRPGERYHRHIAPWVRSVRPATVQGRLYHFAPPGSRGPFPFLVPGDGMVHGDVLELAGPSVLAVLDAIEGHPDLFQRDTVEVLYADGSRERVLAYVLPPGRERRGRVVPSGDWKAERRET